MVMQRLGWALGRSMELVMSEVCLYAKMHNGSGGLATCYFDDSTTYDCICTIICMILGVDG